jgi:uncharacterized protein YfiM (DUF2279 family)
MSVTSPALPIRLSECVRASIDLAIAQWLRNPHATYAAYAALRAAGVAAAEIEERRRARSADPELAAVLHFAVVAVITRGRPEPRDVRRLAAATDPSLAEAILDAAASSRRHVALAALLAGTTKAPPIDMNVGDY